MKGKRSNSVSSSYARHRRRCYKRARETCRNFVRGYTLDRSWFAAQRDKRVSRTTPAAVSGCASGTRDYRAEKVPRILIGETVGVPWVRSRLSSRVTPFPKSYSRLLPPRRTLGFSSSHRMVSLEIIAQFGFFPSFFPSPTLDE